ncbi:hypothetical protein JCM17960_17940 [Magnetospira thiophila]
MTITPARAALIGIFGVLTVLLGIVYMVAIQQVRTILEEEAVSGLQSDLRTLDMAVREMLLKHHYENAEELLLDWARRKTMVSRFVATAPNGFVVAELKRGRAGQATGQLGHDIQTPERPLLTIAVTYDLSSILDQVRSWRQLMLGIFALSVLGLGGILWETVRRSALLPMQRAQAALTEYQDQLESMVEARTQDLEAEIRERTKAEEAMRNQLLFRENLLSAIPAPVFVKDEALIYIDCNEAFEAYLGRPRDEILGRSVHDIAPPGLADIYQKADQDLLASDSAQIYESSVQTGDGQRREVVFHKAVFHRANGEVGGIIGVILDITERKRIERDLARHARKLEWSNSELEQFAYVTSHDLKEPLRTITSYLQLLQMRYADRFDGDARTFIDFAVEGAGRMSRLIQDLLAYSQISTQTQPFAPVNLEQVVDQATANLQGVLEEVGGEILHGALPTVTGDAGQLTRLLQNLIGNGLKYRDPARPSRVEVSATHEGSYWIISVADNGIGIEPAYHQKIFQIFQRLHQQEVYGGTGIGLAICKRIIEQHHGRLWVESELGKGATFRFALPEDATDLSRQ